jgi:hypothetical protein
MIIADHRQEHTSSKNKQTAHLIYLADLLIGLAIPCRGRAAITPASELSRRGDVLCIDALIACPHCLELKIRHASDQSHVILQGFERHRAIDMRQASQKAKSK